MMIGKTEVALLMVMASVALAQIPSFGWCPDYVPMAEFEMKRFLGRWYEAERYFMVTEIGTRCVTTDYNEGPNNKIYVSNKITNRLTNIKRIVSGELQLSGKAGEGKLNVRYNVPLPYDTTYSVLDTDYDTYAVMWSCSGIGPLHTQNAWLLTRERTPAQPVLQQAYGVLDKFKISRTFFTKTDQESCEFDPTDSVYTPPGESEAAEEDDNKKSAPKNSIPVKVVVDSAVVPKQADVVSDAVVPSSDPKPVLISEHIQSVAKNVEVSPSKEAEHAKKQVKQ